MAVPTTSVPTSTTVTTSALSAAPIPAVLPGQSRTDPDFEEYERVIQKSLALGEPLDATTENFLKTLIQTDKYPEDQAKQLIKFFKHPENSPAGPVPIPNEFMWRAKKNNKGQAFFKPREEDYLFMMRLNLICLNSVAPVLANLPDGSPGLKKAKEGLKASLLLYEHLNKFRKRNYFNEFQSCWKYTGLIEDLPMFGRFIYPDKLPTKSDPTKFERVEPEKLCKKAREDHRETMKELRPFQGKGWGKKNSGFLSLSGHFYLHRYSSVIPNPFFRLRSQISQT